MAQKNLPSKFGVAFFPGPRTIELAGEIADGVIILNGMLPENIEASLTHIGVGAARIGRRVEI